MTKPVHSPITIFGLLLVLAAGGWNWGYAGAASTAAPVDYQTQIKPILTKHCVACHGALKQAGGLRLDTAKQAVQGGESGAAITLGDAEASLLIQRVADSDASQRMPQEGEPLAADEIGLLRSWIQQKAPAPTDEQPEQDPREHWAFQPVVRPTLPSASASQSWVRNPIDAFIAQRHVEHGLTPQREADRAVLIRRAYLDLIGLPPTREEWQTWQTATDDRWHERLVEQLLADPRHGERWARHWMDIWRYSDWWGLGDQLRNSQYHIWHWRDWIIESLNSNLAYDEMVRLMLAADESHPNDLGRLRATGFLARNYFLFNRHLWMDETVEHVSKGFLGLTMNCAKCHDHKFDPIEQVDYYRMRAFFEPYHARLDMVPGQVDLMQDGIPRAFDGSPIPPTYRFERGQESQPDQSREIAPGVPALLAFADVEISPIPLPVDAARPERRLWVIENYVNTATRKVDVAESDLKASEAKCAATPSDNATAECRIATLKANVARNELQSLLARVAAMRSQGATADDAAQSGDERTKIVEAVKTERATTLASAELELALAERRLSTSKDDKKSEVEKEVAKARDALEAAKKATAAEVLATDNYTPLVGAKWTPTRFFSSLKDDPEITFPDQSSGRRTALARWITDKRHPLTARVAVNHLWNRHFGTPLVATVFDFGRKGTPPPNRELLDWLAAEFMNSGWSMKHLHRLIMNSSAYRLSSSPAGCEGNIAKDPDNRQLWRRTPIRLESQVVRDSLLALSDRLDGKIGGPPVPAAEQASSTRRSLYFYHSNNDRDRFLTTFDEALVKECYRRDQSIVPQQALALSNSGLVLDALAGIEASINRDPSAAADDASFIRGAMLQLLGIQATDSEVAACRQALEQWQNLASASSIDPQAAEKATDLSPRARLIWALINHNDFVTLR